MQKRSHPTESNQQYAERKEVLLQDQALDQPMVEDESRIQGTERAIDRYIERVNRIKTRELTMEKRKEEGMDLPLTRLWIPKLRCPWPVHRSGQKRRRGGQGSPSERLK